jgi:uncharacterized protein (TIGR02271 family)
MEHSDYLVVIDHNEERGLFSAQELVDTGTDQVRVRLIDKRTLILPKSIITRQADGTYRVPISFAETTELSLSTSASAASLTEHAAEIPGQFMVVPVVAESLTVSKREVETGVVRITKTVSKEEALVDEPVVHEEVTVERRTVNRYIDEPVKTRYEGDTMIVPLVEEVLVIEKRLLLREELHITKRKVEKRHAEIVTLRREEAHVERFESNNESLKPQEEK